ncbi:MAG TPA: hypothetical protein DCW46_01570 [Desulfotomaculum sp.]|nr:hypothetical protein [Desulfotomaculum sp.]HAU30984.1 hypothetical protein [Desulfotomaculum sp.]
MTFIAIGCFAFALLFIFDLNKLFYYNKSFTFCFPIGVALLCFSTIGIIFGSYPQWNVPLSSRFLFGTLSAISLLLVVYTLFFALPFRKTYCELKNTNTVIDTGMYALCRHPGVIWFFFFYLFLWLASGKTMMMLAGIVWTVMDIIHAYIQDRWIFPKTLNDYEQYKDKAPFLIPNLNSIRKCMATLI